jgi:hypothetical protein
VKCAARERISLYRICSENFGVEYKKNGENMYFYRAYDLTIAAELHLPELVEIAPTLTDITIKFGKVDRTPMRNFYEGMDLYTTNDCAAFYWEEVGAISIRSGCEIIIDPFPGVEERLLHLPLLGIAFSVVLHQRGFFELHGSAIEINGSAAIFMAGKGWGKSTLAATLYSRGHHLITDDLIAIRFDESGNPFVIPAFPQLKLLPEAAAFALGDDPDTLPPLAAGYEKRARLGIDRFSQKPIPLKGIYQLDKGETLALIPLKPQEATFQLIANSFVARCASPLLEGEAKIKHFRDCMKLIKQVPIYRLERPHDLQGVPAIAQLVERNLMDQSLTLEPAICHV